MVNVLVTGICFHRSKHFVLTQRTSVLESVPEVFGLHMISHNSLDRLLTVVTEGTTIFAIVHLDQVLVKILSIVDMCQA